MADWGRQEFAELVERHRRELHVHCYRMLASFDDAEDAVQETLLRAWRGRAGFDGSELVRAWLYRIATNVCIDQQRHQTRRAAAVTSFSEVSWLQPYPDRLLDELAPDGPDGQDPASAAVERETIELAFLAALQALPPRQRAAFVLRDVLGRPAQETAGLLETSVAAANSAVQRARVTMRERLAERRSDWSAPDPSRRDRELLAKFIEAHDRGDLTTMVAISTHDLRVTMPPYPHRFDGLEAVKPLFVRAAVERRDGDWRLLPTSANRMPTAASYLRRPGETAFLPFKLDVLHPRGEQIAEITTFGPALFPALGLPSEL